jgi:hypothetical protein
MAKKDNKPLKASQWFGIADQFIRGASMLAEYIELSGSGAVLLPDLTSRAFATEAYLKCLLTIRRRKCPNVHNLEMLFGLLPPADQKYNKAKWDVHSLPTLVAAADDPTKPKGFPVVRDLEGALHVSKDAFIEWRYETSLGAVWYLLHFPFFVRERILESKPKWEKSPPDFLGKFPKPQL